MKYIAVAAIFTVMSVLGFLLMRSDKRRAEQNKWRIREATLFTVALFGGGIGTIAGMYVFRHKTKHKSFVIGVPFLTLLSVVIAAIILVYI